jgi:L-ascorbate metabolism protein UlaG (beta-lactamase superfamily)
MTEVALTHIGGPTVLIEAAGWRILSDPTFDPAGGATASGGAPARRRRAIPARGLDAWERTTIEAPGRPALEIIATPCRHGPPLSRPIVGHVVGFALRWDGQDGGIAWISGDTVLYRGVKEVAERLDVDIAIMHLGEVQFPITGPIRYSMTAADAVELCELRRASRSRCTTRVGRTSTKDAT